MSFPSHLPSSHTLRTNSLNPSPSSEEGQAMGIAVSSSHVNSATSSSSGRMALVLPEKRKKKFLVSHRSYPCISPGTQTLLRKLYTDLLHLWETCCASMLPAPVSSKAEGVAPVGTDTKENTYTPHIYIHKHLDTQITDTQNTHKNRQHQKAYPVPLWLS